MPNVRSKDRNLAISARRLKNFSDNPSQNIQDFVNVLAQFPLTRSNMELQAWTKYLEQSKEIKQNWAGTENFIFDCLYKNFGSKKRTGFIFN